MNLNQFIKSNRSLFFLLQPLRWLVHKAKYNRVTDKCYIVRTFEKKLGYKLNLTDPQTFNEKIQWMKLYIRDHKHTILADKLRSRDYVANLVGEEILIPLHLTTNNVNDICANNLPDSPVVIKTNHASGKVFIIRNKNTEDFAAIRQRLAKTLDYNFYHAHREWQYKNIKPLIMVEKFIPGKDGAVPMDYKFHCFNGEPKYIEIMLGRFQCQSCSYYTTDWEKIALIIGNIPDGNHVEKPTQLDKMLNVAKQLSADFPYIRVDLYANDDSVFFGELTFTPSAGFSKFHPFEFDKLWGSHFSVKHN